MEDAIGKINWARVILGGLLAGVIINALQFVVNSVVFAPEWDAATNALSRLAPSNVRVISIIWGFLVGISAIWLYAAARPRFGPGPETAVRTGIAFCIFSYVLPTIGNWEFGLFSQRLLVIGVVTDLVEVIVASLAGAWLYHE